MMQIYNFLSTFAYKPKAKHEIFLSISQQIPRFKFLYHIYLGTLLCRYSAESTKQCQLDRQVDTYTYVCRHMCNDMVGIYTPPQNDGHEEAFSACLACAHNHERNH